MEAYTVSSAANSAPSVPTYLRILCLGNELLADDSFGHVVADHLHRYATPEIEVVSTPEAGFHLLDYILNTRRLVVVDSVQTGKAPVGTVYVFRDKDLQIASGSSPHYVGLYESVLLARSLGLAVAGEIVIVAVEIADSTTLGAEMHSALRAAIPEVVQIVRDIMAEIDCDSAFTKGA